MKGVSKVKSEIIGNQLGALSKYTNEFSVLFTISMTGVTWALGGWDDALMAMLILIGLDIVTGVLKGFFSDKKFSSHRLRKGFVTKIGYLVVIFICNLLDMVFFAESPILRTASVWFYIYVEGSSILENLGSMGVPVPQFVVDRMEQINKKVGATAKFKKEDDSEPKG